MRTAQLYLTRERAKIALDQALHDGDRKAALAAAKDIRSTEKLIAARKARAALAQAKEAEQ